MHDAFTKSASVKSVLNRPVHKKAAEKFSPSFGVHRGLIKDPNWPPAAFPEHGTAASRRFRRVELPFEISLRGEVMAVTGDISEGGAMFLLDHRLDAKHVDVVFKGHQARVEVLSTSKKGARFAHHCRFLDVAEVAPLWAAVAQS
ncbi:MAG: PilZ domain-containing protein [Myxococcota bacterium]